MEHAGCESRIYTADSEDLFAWTPTGPAVTDQAQEGPTVFPLGGVYWMVTDGWSDPISAISCARSPMSTWRADSVAARLRYCALSCGCGRMMSKRSG